MTAIDDKDIKWMVTVSSGRLRWWFKADVTGHGHCQVKGSVGLVATTNGFFHLTYDGDLVDDTMMAVIKPVKGSFMLPTCGSWKMEHKKIKSTNARGRAMVLCFDDHQDPLDRIQVSFPIVDVDNAVDDGKLFIKAIQRALEERGGNKSATGGLLNP